MVIISYLKLYYSLQKNDFLNRNNDLKSYNDYH